MNSNMQKNPQTHGPGAASILPPAIMEETPWDILLALHSDRHCRLGLAKLASLVSVARPVLDRWLAGARAAAPHYRRHAPNDGRA
jgi:hypothetical protein